MYRDEPIEAADVDLTASAPFRYSKRLDFGRYRLELAERGGLGIAEMLLSRLSPKTAPATTAAATKGQGE